MKTRELRDIPGFEKYRVGDDGTVWSLKSGKCRQLCTRINKQTGYLTAYLWQNDQQHTRTVHDLVLLAFVGPRPEGMVACHWDNDRSNASLANLRWATRTENELDKHRHGTRPIGENNGHAKLNADKVRWIRDQLEKGVSQGAIGRLLLINQAQIHRVATGKAWSHIL
jgi:hypothetical protein